jgi:hypothetical protein
MSTGYLWYQGLVVMIEALAIFAALVSMNIILVQKFKKYLAWKRTILANPRLDVRINNTSMSTQNTDNGTEEDPQRRITFMVIIHSSVFIVSRTIVTINTMFTLYYQYSGTIRPASFYLFDFCNTFLLYLASLANFFIYYTFNKNFKTCLIEMTKSVFIKLLEFMLPSSF